MKSIDSSFSFFVPIYIALLLVGSTTSAEDALSPELIRCPPEFKVELLRSARAGEDSWISMTFDKQGNVIVGLDNVGVGKLTLADKADSVTFERLDNELKHCRGVLWAHDRLYVDATNSNRIDALRDRDGDGKFETRETIVEFDYRSRYGHGSNQMRLGPDGKIYVVVGNDCSFPSGVLATSPYKNPQNDWLIPNSRDKGHDNRVGYILRMDEQGKRREIVAGGFRNPVDMAFNRHGDMFTFDADMEWDVGAPWYRPIRVNHIVSGGEYGWRWGTGKMPAYYPDSLPSNLDVGLGSPTGVTCGTDARLPAKYQDALFLGDWQNGRILAAHPILDGASYRFEYESFVDGAPLNVCDLEFGRDGNLYFITGGRGSQSALYRVSWQGVASRDAPVPSLNKLHEQRRMIEKFHTGQNSAAVGRAWPSLGDNDPWLRHAARLAVERQDLEQWEEKVFSAVDRVTALNGLLALVRVKATAPSTRHGFIERVTKKLAEFDGLSAEELIQVCRTYAIMFCRHGQPSEELRRLIRSQLDSKFPHSREMVNRELCELLVYAGSKEVLDESLNLLEPPTSQETQIEIARLIYSLPVKDWSVEQLRRYIQWLDQARRFRGGRSLVAEIQHLQTDFVEGIPVAVKSQLAENLSALSRPLEKATVVVTRELVQQWTLEELSELTRTQPNGDVAKGRQIFVEAQCSRCHRKDDLGGQIGPDLTTVGKRFNRQTMLEAIVYPAKVIDAKYAQATYILNSGKTVTGRVAHVSKDRITIEIDPLAQTTVDINRDDIETTSKAATSPMPTGLLNYFRKDEIRHLLRYLGTSD